jgi:hypothetical protein
VLSLAPIFYRNVLKKDGGPIERIVVSPISNEFNDERFEAAAFLRNEHIPKYLVKNKIYGNPHGTGSDNRKSIACNKAISEALERWAYYESCGSIKDRDYGFDIDPMSSGMAAFPGLSKHPAKTIALYEALERWALVEWWIGNLRGHFVGSDEIKQFRIFIPTLGTIVISWCIYETSPIRVAYGFAAGKSHIDAFNRSKTELHRNVHVLKKYFSRPIELSELHMQERRVVHFAQQDGFNSFLKKVNSSNQPHETNSIPNLMFDLEIRGPWSKYTTVWRCLYQSSIKYEMHEDILDFFLF